MPTGKHYLYSWNSPVPHRQTQGHKDRSKETQRGAQSFCDTEKSYNEEARTSAYEQPKHHE